MTKIDWLHHEETTKAEAISALQEQEAKTQLSREDTTLGVQKTCNELATIAKDICVPIKDSISRQAAIEALNRCTDVYHTNLPPLVDKEEVRNALTSLPSAQPEPQWIPCSERLPDDLGDYLVSIKRIGWNMEEYVENDIAYWDDLEGFHKADEVLAWMPLPEPYRAERRTDE